MKAVTRTEKQIKSMRLPLWLIAEIEKKAKEENRNFSNMVEVMLSANFR